MLFEQLLTTYSKKWEDWNNTREYIQWLDTFLSELASKKQTLLEKQQVIIKEEKELQQKFDTIAIKLKSIKDRETQNKHFNRMQILNGQLRKLFNQRNELIDELATLGETEKIKKSERVNNTIVFSKLKKELVTLKAEIKEAGFLTGSINQLNKSMKTLQAELIQYELKQEKNEKELQSLENLMQLVAQKLAIEAKLQELENDREQLKVATLINDKKINNILDDKKSPIYKLIDNINELTLNNQKLINERHEQRNLISALTTKIKTIAVEIKSKEDVQKKNMKVFISWQNWKDSFWRRAIVVITIGFFCRKKSVIKKWEKAHSNLTLINEEIIMLRQRKIKSIKQKSALDVKLLANKKNICTNDEALKRAKKELTEICKQDISLEQIGAIETKNAKNQVAIEVINREIHKQKKELLDIVNATSENTKTLKQLERLYKAKSDNLNLDLKHINEKKSVLKTIEQEITLKNNEAKSEPVDALLDDFNLAVKQIQIEKIGSQESLTNSEDSGIESSPSTPELIPATNISFQKYYNSGSVDCAQSTQNKSDVKLVV